MHAVAILKLVSNESAVLAATARYDDVVLTATLTVAIAKLDQLPLALPPVDVLRLYSAKSHAEQTPLGVEPVTRGR